MSKYSGNTVLSHFRIFTLPAVVFLTVSTLLFLINGSVNHSLILTERFFPGVGWITIFLFAMYGAFISYKMLDPGKTPKWRVLSWNIFSVFFFLQLICGITISDTFLMTGKLHLPLPAMILAGPLYRGELSFMTILFLSTIVLTGPAWCSHLCYFGAIDGWAAQKKPARGKIKYKFRIKTSLLLLVIFATLILKWAGCGVLTSLLAAIGFAIGGLIVILLISEKRGKMMQCILYCPIGTLVNYLKFINPFRLKIAESCSFCAACSEVCKYDALSLSDIARKKPGITCTLCGDCLSACHVNAFHYSLFNLKPDLSRKIYLFITVSVHAVFMALARI